MSKRKRCCPRCGGVEHHFQVHVHTLYGGMWVPCPLGRAEQDVTQITAPTDADALREGE